MSCQNVKMKMSRHFCIFTASKKQPSCEYERRTCVFIFLVIGKCEKTSSDLFDIFPDSMYLLVSKIRSTYLGFISKIYGGIRQKNPYLVQNKPQHNSFSGACQGQTINFTQISSFVGQLIQILICSMSVSEVAGLLINICTLHKMCN